jgi:hypothetical protein
VNNTALLGTWIRRFLLEHLVAERNLALNTQRSTAKRSCCSSLLSPKRRVKPLIT